MLIFRHLYLFFGVIILCVQVLAQPNIAQVSGKKNNTYALIIGISTYESQQIRQLQYGDKDASFFASYLMSKAGGEVPRENIKILLNKEADIATIYTNLDWLKNTCSENDLVYIYFSGHGDIETTKIKSLGYLLAYNSPPNNYVNNAISIEDLNADAQFITLEKKAKIILITDACHSGKLAGDFFKGKDFVNDQLQKVLNDQVRLTACQTGQLANESVAWGGGRGAFSYYLLKGLNGFADNNASGEIALKDLKGYLSKSFEEDKTMLDEKLIQNPVLDGNPNFKLVIDSTQSFKKFKENFTNKSSTNSLPNGLSVFKKAGPQFIDTLFSFLEKAKIVNPVKENNYKNIDRNLFSEQFMADVFNQEIAKSDSLTSSFFIKNNKGEIVDFRPISIINPNFEKIKILKDLLKLKQQLYQNKTLHESLINDFVSLTHRKGQKEINDYLTGNKDDLNKRQYYEGTSHFDILLNQLQVAIQLVKPENQLLDILKVNYSYLAGLIARLKMATSPNLDSLSAIALKFQLETKQLIKYAAYVDNELGNLYLQKKDYNMAEEHFDLALNLAPTWAIPWNNKIMLYNAQGNTMQARKAIQMSDSLRPDLPYYKINAGLAMEREKNWLAAESYYLRAVKDSLLHFLPFERLGHIYLQTNRYKEAEHYFIETKKRKDFYNINNDFFGPGTMLSGPTTYDNTPKEYKNCVDTSQLLIKNKKYYLDFQELKLRISDFDVLDEKNIEDLNNKINSNKQLAFLNHIYGKTLFEKGKYKEAKIQLEIALAGYLPDSLLKIKIIDIISNTIKNPDSSFAKEEVYCLYEFYLSHQYDPLEDFYMLGAIYEKEDSVNQAIKIYESVMSIENNRQNKQAKFQDYVNVYEFEFNKYNNSQNYFIDVKFNNPLVIGGAFKLANLYEKMGDFLNAEKVLINQINLNRIAGKLRYGYDKNHESYYALNINRNYEVFLINFYQRMNDSMPRDFTWKRRAGLYLYNRLKMGFGQLTVKEFAGFYKYVIEKPFPWTPNDYLSKLYHQNNFKIIGTNELVSAEVKIGDPVSEALNYLNASNKLSGEINIPTNILMAMAELNSWKGDYDEAVILYSEITRNNYSLDIKNIIIDNLIAGSRFPEAKSELEKLQKQSKASPEQVKTILRYNILSGNYKMAKKQLRKLKRNESHTQLELINDHVLLLQLQGKYKLAMKFQNKKITLMDTLVKVDREFLKEFSNELFTLSDLLGLQNKEEESYNKMFEAVWKGFRYQNLLDFHPLWEKVVQSEEWKTQIEKIKIFKLNSKIPSDPIFNDADKYYTSEYVYPQY